MIMRMVTNIEQANLVFSAYVDAFASNNVTSAHVFEQAGPSLVFIIRADDMKEWRHVVYDRSICGTPFNVFKDAAKLYVSDTGAARLVYGWQYWKQMLSSARTLNAHEKRLQTMRKTIAAKLEETLR